MTTFEAPRGTHDILPAEQPLWRLVAAEVDRLCSLYGYRPVQTPVFEDTALFQRTSGAGSDIVHKEMYTFEDKSGRSLTLRPEATAPIARAYLEHGLHREGQPAKLYTLGQMYRYTAPQRGNFREFWQLSVEAIGSDDPALDAEVIQVYDELLARLGVTNYELQLNSIGDENCRPQYLERLTAWLDEHDDVLDDEARQKRATSPLRVFDVKSEKVQAALAEAPKIGDALCDECRDHFEQVKAHLENYAIDFTLVPTLVRGLDYYTRTAFEFVDEAIGAKSSICGGGRYDGLIEEIGGRPTPGIGFGAGIERLLLSLEAAGIGAEPEGVDVFVLLLETDHKPRALPLVAELRRAGLSADVDYAGRSLKGQLTHAGRLGAKAVVEWGPERSKIRRSGELDEEVPTVELAERLRR
ncbi:MAG: histidine--tRNA ligase [Gaiellaceae bacterium]